MSPRLRVLLVAATREELDRIRRRVDRDGDFEVAAERVMDLGGTAPVEASFDAVLMAPGAWERWRTAGISAAARSSDEAAPLVLEALTPREHDVLALVADGLPNREIARRLGISEHTVKFHLASVFDKLDASSRTEAVQRGLRLGLIEI